MRKERGQNNPPVIPLFGKGRGREGEEERTSQGKRGREGEGERNLGGSCQIFSGLKFCK